MQFLQHNIIRLLLKAAETSPSATALIQGERSISYAELVSEIKKQAAYFKNKGLQKGDRVMVFLPMTIEMYVVVLALFYSGVAPVFIDQWVSVKRLSLCAKLVGCKGIITKKWWLPLAYIIPGLNNIRLKLSAGKKNGTDIDPQEVSPDDTALITFTTGSTGIPKAANRTHEFLFAQYQALRPLLLQQGTCILNTLPIVTLLNLGLTKTTILPSRGFSAKKPLDLIFVIQQRREIDSIITSPSIAVALAGTNTGLTNIRHIITGGGPLLPAEAKLITAKFSSADIDVVYGSTEAEPISHITAQELSAATTSIIFNKGLPVGKPEDIELKIIQLSGEAITRETLVEMNTGEAGEIIVSGAHVLKSYINNPEAFALNKIKINNTIWHRTGDMGRLDEDGHLYFLGRCNEVIQWQGTTIFPLIISAILKLEENIGDTAFIMKDNKLHIVIEQQYAGKQQSITAHLAMLGIKDFAFNFINKLPRDPRHHTKIDYEKLKQQFG